MVMVYKNIKKMGNITKVIGLIIINKDKDFKNIQMVHVFKVNILITL